MVHGDGESGVVVTLAKPFSMKNFVIFINEQGIVVGRYETPVQPIAGSRVTLQTNGKELSRVVSKLEYKYEDSTVFVQVFLSIPVLDIR